MSLDDIHLIKDNQYNIVYHLPSSELKTVNDTTFKVLSLLKEGYSVEDFEDKDGYIQSFLYSFFDSSLNNGVESNAGETNKKRINRITLHVSNDCNLRCKYCYAQGGNYGISRSFMTEQTAEQFVDFCVKEFDVVDRIVFFGGEPLLNPGVIDLICTKFKQYRINKIIPYTPLFILVTNGTIISNEILKLIKDHIDVVSVSVDGEKEYHDANRVYNDGKGSFEKVASFIRFIQNNTDKTVQYEATYTQNHINSGCRREKVMESLKKQFGILGAVVDEDSLGYYPLIEYWNNILKLEADKIQLEFLPEDFYNIFNKLLNNKDNHFCSIGRKSFAVNCNGDVYACHLLNGKENNKLGNIIGENIFNTPSSYTSFYHNYSLKDTIKCRQCWARRLCGGCTVNAFYNKSTQEFVEDPNNDRCDFMKNYLEKIIAFIVRIRKTPSLWKQLVQISEIH